MSKVNLRRWGQETSHTVGIVIFPILQNTAKISTFDNHKAFMADLGELRGVNALGEVPSRRWRWCSVGFTASYCIWGLGLSTCTGALQAMAFYLGLVQTAHKLLFAQKSHYTIESVPMNFTTTIE